jgi:hypothetical protein
MKKKPPLVSILDPVGKQAIQTRAAPKSGVVTN